MTHSVTDRLSLDHGFDCGSKEVFVRRKCFFRGSYFSCEVTMNPFLFFWIFIYAFFVIEVMATKIVQIVRGFLKCLIGRFLKIPYIISYIKV